MKPAGARSGRLAPQAGGRTLNFSRSYKRKRIPLTVTSGGVVIVHAAGACRLRIRRLVGTRRVPAKASR